MNTPQTTTKYQAYPKYKPSGTCWLGDIPEGWEVKDLKYLLDRNDGGVWGEDFDDEGTPVLRSTEIDISGEWRLDEFAKRKLTPQEKQKALLKEGDLLITKSSGSELHIGKTALVNKEIDELECCFSNFMQRLRPNKSVSSKLLFYFFNSYIAREQYNYFSQSTTGLANLSEGLFGQIIFVKFPESEQKQIVSFLDRETAKIDEMVAKKQKLTELLKEKRQALITHAVTKGLDPKAKMKPSGIDWLGDIPEGWEVKRLKHAVKKLVGGGTPDTGNDQNWTDAETGTPWVNIADMTNAFYIKETEKRITSLGLAEKNLRILPQNTLLYSMYASLGKVALLDVEAVTNQAILGVVEDKHKAISDFIKWWLISVEAHLSLFSTSSTQNNLNEFKVKNMPLFLPSLSQQESIADFLDRETAKIDEMMKKVKTQIEKLQEYRQALITSAVTGKINVVDIRLANIN